VPTYSPNRADQPSSAGSEPRPIEQRIEHFLQTPDFADSWPNGLAAATLQPQVAISWLKGWDAACTTWTSADAPYFGLSCQTPGQIIFFLCVLDAPIGYLAKASKNLCVREDIDSTLLESRFQAPRVNHFHLQRNIINFHPCSAGLFCTTRFPAPPTRLGARFLTVNAKKMSKSRAPFIMGPHLPGLSESGILRYYLRPNSPAA